MPARSSIALNEPLPSVEIAGTSSNPVNEVLTFPRSPATAAAVITTTPSAATPIASFTRRLRMGTSLEGCSGRPTQHDATWFA